MIENFRTGTMEKWGLGWEDLKAINPRLVMVRVTGFGQTGPYRHRPGFGTIAEAFSGFAAATGMPDGPPTLPNFGLADGIAAAYGTFAAMFALYHRDATGAGVGQYIDLSIYEPLFLVMGPQPLDYDQLGIIAERMGNRSKTTPMPIDPRRSLGGDFDQRAGHRQAGRLNAWTGGGRRPALSDPARPRRPFGRGRRDCRRLDRPP